jgi:exodeoxyribonuclease V alpha subunit
MATIFLTEQQRSAVQMVFENKISILTGKPGTGKTTTVKAIIDHAIKSGLRFIQAAPTGKAAKRMIESTGHPAGTIHSILGPEYSNGEFSFNQNADNPLRTDLVIIDEVSMVTTDLAAHLMNAIDTEKTRILLVGDTGQLPSVGGGAVLRDLLASGIIPHTELDIIHRNSGKIIEACHAIHEGIPFSPETTIDLEQENPINLIHVQVDDPDEILTAIETIACDQIGRASCRERVS